ncbi:MAG: EFR1 family ferrodoxin, partial [Spirochaetales bacterium]|nr:EFR1 family ferrodoxin [Spirochaetales bacterium]
MKKIYVFTSTGNSLHLARILARELEECEILSIPRLMEESEWTIDGDAAGFIFPCYYGTVPQIVSRFIRGAADITGRKFFAMISAGRSTGLAMEHLRELLEERGKSLHYGRSLTMVSNYM